MWQYNCLYTLKGYNEQQWVTAGSGSIDLTPMLSLGSAQYQYEYAIETMERRSNLQGHYRL